MVRGVESLQLQPQPMALALAHGNWSASVVKVGVIRRFSCWFWSGAANTVWYPHCAVDNRVIYKSWKVVLRDNTSPCVRGPLGGVGGEEGP